MEDLTNYLWDNRRKETRENNERIWDLESSEMAGVPQPVVGPVKTSLL